MSGVGTTDISVTELGPSNFEDWFALDGPNGTPDELREKITRQVCGFEPAILRKLVARNQGLVVARMNALERPHQGITIWCPTLCAGAEAEANIVRTMLDYIKNAPWRSESVTIETKVSRQESKATLWEDSLRGGCFHLVSENIIMVLSKKDIAPARRLRVDVVGGDVLHIDELCALYLRCQNSSLDRESVGSRREMENRFQALATEIPTERWRVFLANEEPKAVCVTGIEDGYRDRTCWVHFIGVDPEARRRGIGRALLSETIDELTRDCGGLFQAFIDVENKPSQALHYSIGFRESAGQYATYRYGEIAGEQR